MYAFVLINFINFSKHHKQHCKTLSKKSTKGPALPANLQKSLLSTEKKSTTIIYGG